MRLLSSQLEFIKIKSRSPRFDYEFSDINNPKFKEIQRILRNKARKGAKPRRERTGQPSYIIPPTLGEKYCPELFYAHSFAGSSSVFFPMNAWLNYKPTLRHSVKSLVCPVVAVQLLRFAQCRVSATSLPSILAIYKDSTNWMMN